MTNTTYLQAADLKVTINYLTDVKTELANASTQAVVVLKKRKQPNPAPAALTTALDAVETNLVGQAQIAVQNQIDTLQAQFDAL